jgi:AraC-like DNA-binding protein
MSKKRQGRLLGEREPGLLVRAYAATHPAGVHLPTRTYRWDQLAHASQGVMSVVTPEGTWVVPPHRAVWIPHGTAHRVEMAGRVAVRTLFFAAGLARALPRRCQAVNVSPLLRELILHASRTSPLRRAVGAEARLAGVILDQLQLLPAVPLQLPTPRDARARKAAALLEATPGAPLADVARGAGASKRTLERLFRRETHLTLGRWHQRLRLIAALRLLAQSHSVTEVALDVGYESPSAFIAAFRRLLGTTPARYFSARGQ